ncbi:MAG TPA: helicase HerA-like domain-containing protein [Polyangiaceae bacterium]|nr:helicase HerA-like domain-containing protein [Polyangiaceae bacterium]
MSVPKLYLGAARAIGAKAALSRLDLPAHHLVTHGVVVGTTGSGKTGFLTVMVEEALRNQVPVLIIDVKGDLPNLLLSFPDFSPELLLPWIDGFAPPGDTRSPESIAAELAHQRQQGLNAWGIAEPELQAFRRGTRMRVITPGASAGELLHVLSSLERHSERWNSDPEAARDSLSAAVSLVLRLIGRDPDPAKSREHVLLMVLAERRLSMGQSAQLEALLDDITRPPVEKIGALTVDAFLPKGERKALAASLNSLLASPSFASWRQGTTLDIGSWFQPINGKTPGIILSVAHLGDEERALVLGVVFEEILAWVRTQPGTQRLRALVVFDEVYGFLPPYPANPPTKRPIVSLIKQARAFGVGVVLATQNPMDLDYRALGNAGLWCIGRLQTDADRARVLDSIADSSGDFGMKPAELADIVKRLTPRWFILRDSHSNAGLVFLQPRWTMTYMRGPMTRIEIRKARELLEPKRVNAPIILEHGTV